MLKHHTVRLQKVPIFPNRDSAPSATPAPAPPPSPWPHRRLPVSLDVTPPGTSCEEDHAGFVLLCLVYVTERSVPKVHPHPGPVSVSFLLRPRAIPLGAGQGARGLLPPSGCCEQCCSEHGCANLFELQRPVFLLLSSLFRGSMQEWDRRVCSIFDFSRTLHPALHSGHAVVRSHRPCTQLRQLHACADTHSASLRAAGLLGVGGLLWPQLAS